MTNHIFPPGELIPDDELAPTTAESLRYVFQLRRINRVVKGLRELDATLGEKIDVAAGMLGPVNANLEETRRALEGYISELAAQRASMKELIETVGALDARLEKLIEAVRSLDARFPDPTEVRREILKDLWESVENRFLVVSEVVEKRLADATLVAAREGAALALEMIREDFVGPRPEDSASLGARIRFGLACAVFRLRKYNVSLTVVATALLIVGVQFAAVGI
jgi:predicted nuclease with TOPRIM domain